MVLGRHDFPGCGKRVLAPEGADTKLEAIPTAGKQ
jgi:hypothetical protein